MTTGIHTWYGFAITVAVSVETKPLAVVSVTELRRSVGALVSTVTGKVRVNDWPLDGEPFHVIWRVEAL